VGLDEVLEFGDTGGALLGLSEGGKRGDGDATLAITGSGVGAVLGSTTVVGPGKTSNG
jgi:hypothetical protein